MWGLSSSETGLLVCIFLEKHRREHLMGHLPAEAASAQSTLCHVEADEELDRNHSLQAESQLYTEVWCD